MSALIKGYFVTLSVLIIAGVVFYFAAEISGRLLDAGRFAEIILYATPVLGALVSGWHCRKGKGFMTGFKYGLSLLITVLTLWLWFLPATLAVRPMCVLLLYLAIVPALAGGFACNLKKLRPAPPENKN